jgi:hypothetical protein
MKSIDLYAQEISSLCGRGFNLTEFPLKNGFVYSGVLLFDSHELATSDAEKEAEVMRKIREADGEYDEDDDVDETEIIKVRLLESGEIFDFDRNSLIGEISEQNNQSPEVVREALAQYFTEAERRLRHAADIAPDSSAP